MLHVPLRVLLLSSEPWCSSFDVSGVGVQTRKGSQNPAHVLHMVGFNHPLLQLPNQLLHPPVLSSGGRPAPGQSPASRAPQVPANSSHNTLLTNFLTSLVQPLNPPSSEPLRTAASILMVTPNLPANIPCRPSAVVSSAVLSHYLVTSC